MKSISSDFFQTPYCSEPVKTGSLLVAQPFLKDKWFAHSIISVIDNGDEGTTGLIMNMELATTLSEVFTDIKVSDVPVFCGGPMGHDRLFFIHSLGDKIIPDAKELYEGLWLGGSFSAIADYLNSGYDHKGTIRFFIGYSGWSSGQLDEEIKEKTWSVSNCCPSPQILLEGEGGNYWHKIIRTFGEKYRRWNVLPTDIRSN